MFNRNRAFCLLFAAFSLSVAGLAQQTPATPTAPATPVVTTPAPAQADATYTIKATPKVGDTYTYTLTGVLEMQKQAVNFTAKIVEKIKDVKDSGLVTVEQAQEDAKISLQGGDPQSMPDQPAVTQIMNADGTVNEIKADDPSFSGSAAYRDAALDAIQAPAQPVKIGDTWTYKAAHTADRWVATQVDYKLVGLEKIGNYDCVKIEFKAKETEGATPGSQEGTVWLSVADFSVVKRVTKVTAYPLPMDISVDGTLTMIRV